MFKTTNIQYFVIFILSAGFLFIENVADASFTSNRGLFIMMFLGLLLSAQKTQYQELLAEQKEKV